jgi:predicted RNA-binding protein YlxR (DUF448 family)
MSKKDAFPRRKQPQRTCVGCRTVQDKRSLIRVVRTPDDGIQIDQSGKLHGRGAYLHDQKTCWEKGLKGSLSKALRVQLTEEDNERLSIYMQELE